MARTIASFGLMHAVSLAIMQEQKQCYNNACNVCCCLHAEHQYTEANLSFGHLRGNDRAMARTLSTCPGIDAHLVLVTRTVPGGAEHSGGGCCKRRRCCEHDGNSEDAAGRPHTADQAWWEGSLRAPLCLGCTEHCSTFECLTCPHADGHCCLFWCVDGEVARVLGAVELHSL